MFRVFRQYIPGSFLLLGAVEYLLLVISVYGTAHTREWLHWVGAETSVSLAPISLPTALFFALVVSLAMTSMGLYQPRFRFAAAGMLLRIGIAFVGAGIAMGVLYFVFPILAIEQTTWFCSYLNAGVIIFLVRAVFLKTLDKNLLKRKILVLGAGATAAQVGTQLRRRVDHHGFTIVGYVHVKGEHDVVDENMVMRPDVTLFALATELQVDEIVVAVGERRRKSFPVHDLLDCKLSGIDVIDLLGFFERETGKVKLDILNPSWLIFSDGFHQSKKYVVLKRFLDILVCILLLFITWPLIILAAAAILIESKGKGSVLYPQIRVGQHWKLFSVYKFRSMEQDAEKDGVARWAKENDERITRVGKVLRKIRLDELPQIINVLKGDMSLVGPRPERPEFVTELAEHIPYFAERHRMKPGITGWAQLRYPYGSSEHDSMAKLEYDLYYVKNSSLFLDIIILLQTVEVILWRKGAR
jgi:sugar transferase (PEP-CTERM system associated)